MVYSLPRDVFLLLETACNQDRGRAEVFAKAIEGWLQAIENQPYGHLSDKKETLKAQLYSVRARH